MDYRPEPLPQEFARGYHGMIMRMNGFANDADAVKALRAWSGDTDTSQWGVPHVLLLAKVAGMGPGAFVRAHTALPLLRGITSHKANVEHGSFESNPTLRMTAMRSGRHGAYFCAQCAKEDLDVHGYSYWRCDQQTPGLYWCSKHGDPLHFIDDDNAFLKMPSHCLDQARSIDDGWAIRAKDSPVVARFHELCAYLMDRPRSFAVKDVMPILRARARGFGFQISTTVRPRRLLSDYVIETLGRQWLATVLPSLSEKPKGVFSMPLDGLLFTSTSASSTFAYVLAATALFESAEDAMNAFLESEAPDEAKAQASPWKGVESVRLVEAYVQAKGSYRGSAQILSSEVGTVGYHLKKLGFPNLEQRGRQNLHRALAAFYVEKRSIIESAMLGGLSTSKLEFLVRAPGTNLCQILQAMERPAGSGSRVRRTSRQNSLPVPQAVVIE